MISFFVNSLRLTRLGFSLLLHGVPVQAMLIASGRKSPRLEKRLGKNLVGWLQNSGPSFIKLGQILSTRPDITGDIISEELSLLRDKLPPFSTPEVLKIIESELGGKYTDFYEDIESKPVAAASIAQVHRAVTINQDLVAIKVLRPGIAKKFRQDIALFYFVAGFVNKFVPKAYRLRLKEVIKSLEKTVQMELDLRYEAASAERIRENVKGDSGIKIPKIFWKLTSKEVLTMSWVEGIPVNDKKALVKQGHDLEDVSKKLATSFFNQAYRDGFFHADLHPGNLFVDKDGDIVMVDFGITGSLAKADRLFVAEVLYCFIKRNYSRIADLHFKYGIIPASEDKDKFALACQAIGEPVVGMPVNKISMGKLLKQLLDVSGDFNVRPQIQFLLLQKTLVTIEGVGQSIYPDVNMWRLVEPWIKKWAKQNFGYRAKLKEASQDLREFIIKLPHALATFNDVVELGQNYLLTVKEHKRSKKSSYIGSLALAAVAGALVAFYALNI
ncbi:MAG: 2-polyprenylphenol 6-hydroxylase [Rickettsiales bacterium]